MKLSTVGVVGAGQLGRMMALAGYPLGLRFIFLDRSPDAPGAQVAPIVLGELEDAAGLAELASRSQVLTFDWENVSRTALAPLEATTLIRPPPRALEVSQDRLSEKALFTSLGIPVAPHAAVDDKSDLLQAIARLGAHAVLKTRRLGYDGKGQCIIGLQTDLDEALNRLGGTHLIYEAFQHYTREVSIIGVRSSGGEIAFYPLAANSHHGGILRFCVAPYHEPVLERTAQRYLRQVLEALDYIGVLTIEFFVVDGRLIANEMAPRVHNSGHWTIEGCVTSQFENHVRAICDLPLGSTRTLGHAAMINFLGEMPEVEKFLVIEGLAFHDYGKQARPGRKLGHCTLLKPSEEERDRGLAQLLEWMHWK